MTQNYSIALEKANLVLTYKQYMIAKGAFSSVALGSLDHAVITLPGKTLNSKDWWKKKGFGPEGCAFLVTMHISIQLTLIHHSPMHQVIKMIIIFFILSLGSTLNAPLACLPAGLEMFVFIT